MICYLLIVTIGALVIGIICSIGLAFDFAIQTFIVIVFYATETDYRTEHVLVDTGRYAGQVLILFAIVFLFVGLKKRQAAYLLPFLAVNVVGMLTYVGYALYVIVIFAQLGLWIWSLIYAAIVVVAFSLNIFFFVTVLLAYQYLKLREHTASIFDVSYAVHPAPVVYLPGAASKNDAPTTLVR